MAIRILIWVLALSLTFPPTYVRAEQEDPVKVLREKLEALESGYRPFLDNSFQMLVSTYYTIRSQDHIFALSSVETKSAEGQARLQQYLSAYQAAYLAIDEGQGNRDAHSITLLANLAMAEREVGRARTLESDAKILGDSWKDACSSEKVDQNTDFFNPVRLFSPDSLGFFAAIRDNVGVGVTYNYSDGHSSVGARTDGLGFSEEEEGTMYGIMAVGSSFPPWGPVIAAAVIVCYGLIKLGLATGRRVAQEEEQWKLINKIYDFQRDQIGAKAQAARPVVETECKKSFPETLRDRMYSALPVRLREAAVERSTQMRREYDEDLRPKQEEYFSNLERVYLPQVQASFLNEMRNISVANLYEAQAIDAFATAQLEPAVTRLQNAANGEEALQLKHDIWSRVILGDALYRKGDHFSFDGSAPENNIPSFGNDWLSWSSLIGREVLQ